MKKIFFLLMVIMSGVAQAQSPQLVYDICTAGFNGSGSSNPNHLIALGNRLYFGANDCVFGEMLFCYDGINPPAVIPPGPLTQIGYADNSRKAVLNGKLYFPGYAPGSTSLYQYDSINGISATTGTVAGGLVAIDLMSADGKLYYYSYMPGSGYELFVYDGNSAPSVIDIKPGPGNSEPVGMTEYSGKIYFRAKQDSNGTQLFSYDPATNSAGMVGVIQGSWGGAEPWSFTVSGNKLYFMAMSDTFGEELYRYDGNQINRLTDLSPGIKNGLLNPGATTKGGFLGALNGKLYFAGSTSGNAYHLYCYDPAIDSVKLVPDASGNDEGYSPADFTNYHGKLYYSAYSGAGKELWATDGITSTLVADISPGTNSSYPSDLYAWNGGLYFQACSVSTGCELHRIIDTSTVTGFQNVAFNGEISLYPNPAKTSATIDITLKAAQNISVALQDATGKIVYKMDAWPLQTGKNSIQIPLTALAAGNYMYSLRNSSGALLYSGKLVKE